MHEAGTGPGAQELCALRWAEYFGPRLWPKYQAQKNQEKETWGQSLSLAVGVIAFILASLGKFVASSCWRLGRRRNCLVSCPLHRQMVQAQV